MTKENEIGEITKRKAFWLGFWRGIQDKKVTAEEATGKAPGYENYYIKGNKAGLERDYWTYDTFVCGLIVSPEMSRKLHGGK